MSVWDLLASFKRHPLIVCVGVVLTLFGAAEAGRVDGVYSSSVAVALRLPQGISANQLQVSIGSIVDTAGVVSAVVGGGETIRFSSQSVPLSGIGVLDGYSVRQQDSGLQFNRQFDRPEIGVQVTGPSPEIVQVRLSQLIDRIDHVLWQIQSEQGVARRYAIVAEADRHQLPIAYETGSGKRAVLSAGLLGAGLTLVFVLVADRLQIRRTQRTGEGDLAEARITL